jgi:hypothetical protein
MQLADFPPLADTIAHFYPKRQPLALRDTYAKTPKVPVHSGHGALNNIPNQWTSLNNAPETSTEIRLPLLPIV